MDHMSSLDFRNQKQVKTRLKQNNRKTPSSKYKKEKNGIKDEERCGETK